MRTFLASAVAVLVMSAQVLASPRTSDNTPLDVVTLILYIDAPQQISAASLDSMKQELRAMLNTDTVVYDFIVPQQAKPPAYFQTLISVRMTGACDVRSRTPSPASGPLAFAHSADGKIIPFIEVQCDRVRGHVRPAFWGPDMDRSEYLYGRALARVLAHELYHVLTGRKAHTTLGITRKSLTGSQLISDHVEFESATLHSTSNGLH